MANTGTAEAAKPKGNPIQRAAEQASKKAAKKSAKAGLKPAKGAKTLTAAQQRAADKAAEEAKRYGEGSREFDDEALKKLWAEADAVNAKMTPGELRARGRWVPFQAVKVVESLQPRTHMDNAVIERYAESFYDLPPVSVQRKTFVLLDGRQRMEAASIVHSELVRIVELPVKDKDLLATAVKLNANHGMPLSTSDRAKAARRIMAERPELTTKDVADLTGLTERSIRRYKEDADRIASGGPSTRPASTNGTAPATAPTGTDAGTAPAAPVDVSGGAPVASEGTPEPQRPMATTPDLAAVPFETNGHGEAVGLAAAASTEFVAEIEGLAATVPAMIAQRLSPEQARRDVQRAGKLATWLAEYMRECRKIGEREEGEQQES